MVFTHICLHQMALQPNDDTDRVSYPFWFCDACVCLLMSKACVCSGSFVYTSLQLLENGCWCRGFLQCGDDACPAPPCNLVVLDSVLWWVRQVEQQWLFFLFLMCLCSYPGDSVDGAARVLAWWKGFIPSSPCFPGRQLHHFTLVTHCVCVLHTHSLVSRLCV
jgi:hypothetical protein